MQKKRRAPLQRLSEQAPRGGNDTKSEDGAHHSSLV